MVLLDIVPVNQTSEAFLELHVEQGPVLDVQQLDIGVVQGIIRGGVQYLCLVKKPHYPMNMRND